MPKRKKNQFVPSTPLSSTQLSADLVLHLYFIENEYTIELVYDGITVYSGAPTALLAAYSAALNLVGADIASRREALDADAALVLESSQGRCFDL